MYIPFFHMGSSLYTHLDLNACLDLDVHLDLNVHLGTMSLMQTETSKHVRNVVARCSSHIPLP